MTEKKTAAKPRKTKSTLELLQEAVEAARKDGWTVDARADRLNPEDVSEGVTL